ncbi:TetR/AcrR family transcriptional regulator [Glutamicibacter sp. MNS18]|uniref:TetR/AcrR family transcriptional regulator n=1 Tax=Glutamicibacter sp. MNS18 TaxID=2989817 RepID=UPI002236BB7B|nr:TetR/AcrR family transcriptional regulator [Glutamicibacter sp. MNS18]MCW4464820.1 TetR/AcrR family transcriptional regulator [Glutamicibacter sp. MNS18]
MPENTNQPRTELPELPRGLALAWGVAASPQRGPKREMSVERIVESAVAIADAEGLGAVSMAAVAKSLGFSPMSLYRYVTAKDDLLLLMEEEAVGLPPVPDGPVGDWRSGLTGIFNALVQVYVNHPWLLSIPVNGSPITPNNSAWLDAALGVLRETGLSQAERLAVALAISGQARWCGMVLVGYRQTALREGLDEDQFSRREAEFFDAVIDEAGYPHLRQVIDAQVFTSEYDPMSFGLHRLLDGIELHLQQAGGHETPSPEPPAYSIEDPQLLEDKRFKAADKAMREAQKALAAARKVLRQTEKARAQAATAARDRLQGR